jgi:hypothetical protein
MVGQNVGLSASATLPPARSADPVNATLCRIIARGIALLAAAHFALFGYLLYRTAIFSPISDMFTYIDVYLRRRAGEMPLLTYLWSPHGEHHLVWIRLLTWADVEIFHTRSIPFIAAATAAIVATAVLVWQQLRRADRGLGGATGLGLLAPMLILGAANVTDCSVPINTTYPFTIFFVVLALVLFTGAGESASNTHYRRIGALLAAVGASMGTTAGLLAWPILFWIAWRERLNRGWLATLAGLGIVYILFYAQGLNLFGIEAGLKDGPALFFSATHILKLTNYFFGFLGLPVTREPVLEQVGRVIGATLFLAGSLVVLVATFSRRLNTRLDRIAVGLILLAFGSAALASAGRVDLIDGLKVPVRYTIFATALQLGLLCIVLPRAVRYFETPRARVLQCSVGFMLALVLLIMQVFIGRSAARIADTISRDADCFAQGAQTGPVSTVVTRWPAEAEKVFTDLRRQGLLAPRPRDCTTHSQS